MTQVSRQNTADSPLVAPAAWYSRVNVLYFIKLTQKKMGGERVILIHVIGSVTYI